jgi:hypothetical protein
MILARLLSVVAIIGFIISPVMTPPAWAVNGAPQAIHAPAMTDMASMPGMTSAKGAMDCCPQHKPVAPSCPKNCPWAALCSAKTCSNSVASFAYVFTASLSTDPITPGNDRGRDRLREPPPPRPPRT